MRTIPFTVYGPIRGYFLSVLHDYRTTDYDVGHTGTLDAEDGAAPEQLLEVLFAEGNGHGTGPGFVVSGRSMSTGDVIHLEGHGVWFCDSIGWTELSADNAQRFPLAVAA
jgi:hypothetical protein